VTGQRSRPSAPPGGLQISPGVQPRTPNPLCAAEPDLFFSDDPGDIAAAKSACAECPSRLPCLRGAIERSETYGVWGGGDFNPEHRQGAVA
jgi:WhiB family redox-sensing transcriptional regulator